MTMVDGSESVETRGRNQLSRALFTSTVLLQCSLIINPLLFSYVNAIPHIMGPWEE